MIHVKIKIEIALRLNFYRKFKEIKEKNGNKVDIFMDA